VKSYYFYIFWVDFWIDLGVDSLGKPVELWEVLSFKIKFWFGLSWGVCREVGCDDFVVVFDDRFFLG